MSGITEKHLIRVKCLDCNYIWIAGSLPLKVEEFTKLLTDLCCPVCGADKERIVMATEGDK